MHLCPPNPKVSVNGIVNSLIVVINLLNSNSLLFNKFFSAVVADESEKTWGPNNWDPISIFPLWF